jgi:hypothetical protein
MSWWSSATITRTGIATATVHQGAGLSLETAAGGSIGALEEMRAAFALEVAALYRPVGEQPYMVERVAVAAAPTATHRPAERLVFDAAAWRLATCGCAPLMIRDALWLVDNPFEPPAATWLFMPLADGILIATGGKWR